MSPQLLEISIKEIEGIPIILLKGDLTMKCEEILTKTVEVYAPKTQYKIILDFENVTSVNSTGLAILIGIYMILEEEGGEPTTDSIQKQFDENAAALKKSVEGESKIRIAGMQRRIDKLEANQMRAQLPGNFLTKPLVKSFDDHLAEWYPDMKTKDALDFHLKMVSESIHGTKFPSGEAPSTEGMMKSMVRLH